MHQKEPGMGPPSELGRLRRGFYEAALARSNKP